MSRPTCPTVTIATEVTPENSQGCVVINESDFDEATMTLFEPTAPDALAVDKVAPTAPEKTAKAPKAVAPWAAKTP